MAGLAVTEKSTLTPANGQLNIGEGNTRVGGLAANPPLFNFTPIVVSGEVVHTLPSFPLYQGAFPIRLGAEFLHNTSPADDNEGYSLRLGLGKAGKKRHWELNYEFRELQADAIYEEFPESDFNAYTQVASTAGGVAAFVNGTNIRGHILQVGYSPFDALTLSVKYWITENINESPAGSASAASRWQVDAIWKF